ncbi:MAG: YbiU family protein, partial [SAR324 cluster bacterium]|nr:YbiU family protein [SAR324 cluster bacterium]
MSSDLTQLVKKRGCAVIRQVFTLEQVNEWNEQIVKYIESNQYYDKEIEKRGLDQYFSQLASGRPQIFGLYWSKPQIEARQSEELATTRRWLNRLWDHNQSGKPVFNPDQECSYADRLRRRQPGDSTLGLSPHVDGGSVERWLDKGFHNVYRHVYSGEWQKYDPFAAAHRTETKEIPSPAVC